MTKADEFHARLKKIDEDLGRLAMDVLDEDATVELILFAGTLAAVGAAIENVLHAGPPKHEPHESPHPLDTPKQAWRRGAEAMRSIASAELLHPRGCEEQDILNLKLPEYEAP